MKYFLLIDDHEIVRAGIKMVMQDLFQPCALAEAGNETTALAQLKQQTMDLVIMDVQIPGCDTVQLMEYIHVQYPGTRVLIFSMSAENVYAPRFLKAGAMGFVSKNAGLSELKKAIDLVLNNRKYISSELAELLAGNVRGVQQVSPFDQLSAREADIAMALIKGEGLTEISEHFNISTSTVATYKARVFDKLQVKNLAQLIAMGRLYHMD